MYFLHPFLFKYDPRRPSPPPEVPQLPQAPRPNIPEGSLEYYRANYNWSSESELLWFYYLHVLGDVALAIAALLALYGFTLLLWDIWLIIQEPEPSEQPFTTAQTFIANRAAAEHASGGPDETWLELLLAFLSNFANCSAEVFGSDLVGGGLRYVSSWDLDCWGFFSNLLPALAEVTFQGMGGQDLDFLADSPVEWGLLWQLSIEVATPLAGVFLTAFAELIFQGFGGYGLNPVPTPTVDWWWVLQTLTLAGLSYLGVFVRRLAQVMYESWGGVDLDYLQQGSLGVEVGSADLADPDTSVSLGDFGEVLTFWWTNQQQSGQAWLSLRDVHSLVRATLRPLDLDWVLGRGEALAASLGFVSWWCVVVLGFTVLTLFTLYTYGHVGRHRAVSFELGILVAWFTRSDLSSSGMIRLSRVLCVVVCAAAIAAWVYVIQLTLAVWPLPELGFEVPKARGVRADWQRVRGFVHLSLLYLAHVCVDAAALLAIARWRRTSRHPLSRVLDVVLQASAAMGAWVIFLLTYDVWVQLVCRVCSAVRSAWWSFIRTPCRSGRRVPRLPRVGPSLDYLLSGWVGAVRPAGRVFWCPSLSNKTVLCDRVRGVKRVRRGGTLGAHPRAHHTASMCFERRKLRTRAWHPRYPRRPLLAPARGV